MPGWFAPALPIAPRLHHRRQAKLIFPWGMILCTAAIFLYSVSIGFPLAAAGSWALLVVAAWAAYEFIGAHSLIQYYGYRIFLRITGKGLTTKELNEMDEYYSDYPRPVFFGRRLRLRWILALLITLLTWLLALWCAAGPFGGRGAALLSSMLILYSAIPFIIVSWQAMKSVVWAQHFGSWMILIALLGAAGAVGIWRLSESWTAAAVFGLVVLFVFGCLYLNQRLWLGENAIGGVIQEISMRVLSIKDIPRALAEDIPALISRSLRYDRISILIPDRQLAELTVVGTFGNFSRSFSGEKIPRSAGGVVWRAIERKRHVVWNDIARCPYYLSLFEDRQCDDTRAEVAVPLMHLGEVYGVLDAQSVQPGLFGPGDVDILKTIGNILGAAIASYKEEQELTQAGKLWDELATSTNLSEEQVFFTFAEFAEQNLGTDVCVYYPLSPTGYPYKKPLIYGYLDWPEKLAKGIRNPNGPLVRLIGDWRYHPSTHPESDPKYLNPATGRVTPFIEREGIRSSYFLPVGIKQEPLGALFLNFRSPRQFDGLFDLVVRSFSQAFATIIWKNRYRELIYESFGSPAFNIHYKRGLFGLKAGISQAIEATFVEPAAGPVAAVNTEALKQVARRVDQFLEEIQFKEELIPPDFWSPAVSLERQLVDYINSRPLFGTEGRPTSVKLDFDYRIERENPIVKLAIFRVISEAINNAFLHGQAANVQASIVRRDGCIEIRVGNDGEPLPDDHKDRPSRMTRGILYLFDKLDKGFGAEARIDRREDGTGTLVAISIPSLPPTMNP